MSRHLDAAIIAGEQGGFGRVGLTILDRELQIKGDGVGIGQSLQRGLQEGGAVEGEPAVLHSAAGEGGIIAVAAGVIHLVSVLGDILEVVVQHQGAGAVHLHGDLGAGALGQTGSTQLVLREGILLVGAAPGLFAEDGHGAQHPLVDVLLGHALLALVAPDHALGAHQVGLTHQGVGATKHGGVPVVEQVLGVGHVSVGAAGVGVQEGVPAVDDLIPFGHTLGGLVIGGAPDVQLVVLRQLLGGLAQGGLSGGKAAGAGAPHADFGVLTQVVLDGLAHGVGKLGKGIVGGLVVHPVLIGADVHHVRVHHRVLPTGVLVPQGGGKAQGPLAVGAGQVQQLQLLAQAGGAGGQHGAPGQPLNVVRVLSGVLVVQQGVTGHVQLGEHIHAHVLAHLGQRPPLVLGVGGVALIVLVVVVVVGVDEIGRNACMLGLRGKAGELLALQAVEAGVGLKGGGADVGVVVVVDMQVELVDLVPQHDLGVVLEQLIAVGGTGHVQHDAPHLIGGIVPHDALGNGHMVLGLPQNLLGGNGAIQATSIGGGIDVQPLLIGHHQVALLPQVIGGGVGEGLQIDVVGPGGGGARLHRQGEAGDLLHIGHQVLGHLVQAHIGLVVEDDLGVGGEGKAALIAVPLLDGGNDLWLGVGVGHRGEPLSGIVGGVVGHGDGDILLGIAGLVSPVGKAQQQRHVPSANVPRADGAVIGHHVLQFAAPHHQVRPGDGGQSDLGISQAGIGHSDFIQFSIHVHRGVNVGIGAHERNLGNVHIVAAGGLGVGLVDVQPHIPAQLGLTQSGLGRGGDGVGIAGRVCDVLPLSVDQSGISRSSADIGHPLPGIGILRGVGGLELIFHGPHLVAGIGDLHGLKLRAGGSQVHLEPLRGLELLVLGVVGDLEVLQVRGVPLGGLGAVHRIGCGGPLHGPAGRHRAVEGQVPGLLGGFFRLFGIHLNLPQAHVVAGSGGVHLFHIEAHIPLH